MRIFLVGFMGAGKSTTGRALALRNGALFWDLDARIQARFHLDVPEIFRLHGEAAFRNTETRELAAAENVPDLVVATGGGTFTFDANRQIIGELGVSIFLDLPWGEVARRLPGKRSERPLFGSPEQARRLYESRLPHYRLADVHVRPAPGEDPETLAGRILMMVETLA